ncbi:MAG TPA: hypothetical protein VGY55_18225 [Pirellulales bacterium]|jgi:hypothetical protein|nr:hypothetical protein [Pirellulales bacterium]
MLGKCRLLATTVALVLGGLAVFSDLPTAQAQAPVRRSVYAAGRVAAAPWRGYGWGYRPYWYGPRYYGYYRPYYRPYVYQPWYPRYYYGYFPYPGSVYLSYSYPVYGGAYYW